MKELKEMVKLTEQEKTPANTNAQPVQAHQKKEPAKPTVKDEQQSKQSAAASRLAAPKTAVQTQPKIQTAKQPERPAFKRQDTNDKSDKTPKSTGPSNNNNFASRTSEQGKQV